MLGLYHPKLKRCIFRGVMIAIGCNYTLAASALNRDALYSSQVAPYMDPVEPRAEDVVTVRLRTAAGDVAAAGLKYFDQSLNQFVERPLILETKVSVGEPGRFDLWTATIPASQSRKWYRFWVRSNNETVWYNQAGTTELEPSGKDFWIVPDFKVPEWLKDAVIYQIFVDRFANGDGTNDVKSGEYLYAGKPVVGHEWNEEPENPPWGRDFFGGDLQGIEAKLEEYLQGVLGINALYLNPIFQSPSNHKYDTQDYRQVDPHFGGNQALANLMAAAHSAQKFTGDERVHVILDGVFNHTGIWCPWFDKDSLFPEIGAFESLTSPYRDWYTFRQWPLDYVGWQNFGLLPKLDYGSPSLRQAMYEGNNSVLKMWLQSPYNIDGWRFDVAEDIGVGGTNLENKSILGGMRQAIKGTNPEAATIAEIWENPTPYLEGSQFDSVMNYEGFADPVSRLLTGHTIRGQVNSISVSQFEQWLNQTRASYPFNAAQGMMNLIDSHDTSRFYTRAVEDVSALRLAATLQMTYIGAPTIYYGDEIGMSGSADPFNRRPFNWDQSQWNRTILNHYQKLIKIRRELSSLRRGSFKTLVADDKSGIFAFGRWHQNEASVVVVNLGDQRADITLPVEWLDIKDGATLDSYLSTGSYTVNNGKVNTTVSPRGSMILSTKRRQ